MVYKLIFNQLLPEVYPVLYMYVTVKAPPHVCMENTA